MMQHIYVRGWPPPDKPSAEGITSKAGSDVSSSWHTMLSSMRSVDHTFCTDLPHCEVPVQTQVRTFSFCGRMYFRPMLTFFHALLLYDCDWHPMQARSFPRRHHGQQVTLLPIPSHQLLHSFAENKTELLADLYAAHDAVHATFMSSERPGHKFG